jgi:hypothetical protein
MPRTDAALRALVVACAFGAGCSLIAGLEEHGRLRDASQGGAGGGGDGGKGGGCDGDACLGCAGKVVYVATSGNDASDGCTSAAPKRTVSGAIGYVKTVGAIDHEIHVCGGTYSEPQIVVGYPVRLMGGYECTTWERLDKYGYPTFDDANETRLENTAPIAGATATLVVRGRDVGRDVVIDGLTILGTEDSGTDSFGVLIEDGASPTLTNNVVLGGSGPDLSAAVRVTGGADADIQRCSLHGGTASFTFGVAVVDSRPHVHQNGIIGGKTAGIGTGIGIRSEPPLSLDTASGSAVESNHIVGNLGGGQGVGVGVDGAASVELRANVIRGGEVTGVNNARAVFAVTSGAMRIHANRILAGKPAFGTLGPDTELVGVYLQGTNDSEIVNNMIHGGELDGAGETYGIALVGAQDPFVAHNTIYAGRISGVTAGAAGIVVATPSDVVIQNNLLVGSGTSGSGLELLACNGSLKSLQNNAFANHADGAVSVLDGAACPPGAMDTVEDVEELLPVAYPAAIVADNVAVAANCGAAPTLACAEVMACGPPSEACVENLFDAWAVDEAGIPELLSPAGWVLAAPYPCAIAEGGLDLTGTVVGDAGEERRTEPVSIGARELDAACSQ